jgi:hypothetical protein
MISASGIPIMAKALSCETNVERSLLISLMYFAKASATAVFINSAGCILNEPKEYQAVWPAIVLPKMKSPMRDNMAAM